MICFFLLILEIIAALGMVFAVIAIGIALWGEIKDGKNSQKEIEDKHVEEEISSPIFSSFEEDFEYSTQISNLFFEKHTYPDGIIRELEERSSEIGATQVAFWEHLEAGLNNYLELNPTDAERLVLLDKVVKAKDEFYGFYMVREGKKYELARMSTNFLKSHYPKEAEDYEEVVSSNLVIYMYIEDVSDRILSMLTLSEYPEEMKNHYKEKFTRIHRKYREICANLISNEFKNQIYKEGGPLRESDEFENLSFVKFTMEYIDFQEELVSLVAEEKALDFKPFNKLFQKTVKTNRLERKLLADNP